VTDGVTANVACLVCRAPLPAGARFCPSCGVSVAPVAAGDRRVVTVVFADLAGFTTLAEGRDPEAVKELLDRCFSGLVPVITRFGGHVDKIIGDELMATFGAPTAHEDDPERAVRAALGLLETLPQLAPGLVMRVGVNTGEVLAGPVGPDRAYTVTGDTVNTAHRLVSVAQPGEVLVGERTYQATSDAITYEARPPYRLRGKQAEVRAWVATEALGGPHSGTKQIEAPLIGRDQEMANLLSIAGLVHRTRRATLVVMTGEAGLGKTRLAHDLATRLLVRQPNHQLLRATCPPYGAGSGLEPVADLVRTGLAIDGQLPRPNQVDQLRAHLAPLAPATGTDPALLTSRLAQLLGLYELPAASDGTAAEPTRTRVTDQLLGAARLVIEALSAERPTTLILDDLQWADEAVINFVERLPDRLEDRPLMVLALARDEVLERRGSFASGRPGTVLYPLQPLADGTACELMGALLGQISGPGVDTRLGPEAERRILDAGGGNPLLLEQLLSYLTEQRTLVVEGDRWHVRGTLDHAGLPDGVRSLIGARLDGLPAAERALLGDASVIGRQFWRDALVHLAPTVDVDGLLDSLVERGLIEWSPNLREHGELRFRHVLTRDVAYASLPLGARAQIHAEVARWMRDGSDGEPTGWLAGRLAHHYERAVALSLQLERTDPGLAGAAFTALVRAAREADRNGALREADGWYTRARRLGTFDRAATRQVLLDHGHVLVSLRRLDEARQALETARVLSEGEAPAMAAEAAAWLGVTARLAGDLETAREAFTESRAAWRQLEDRAGEAQALHLEGWSELLGGRPRAALPTLERAADLQRLADGAARASTLRALGWSSFLLGNIGEARERLWAAAGRYAVEDDRSGMAWCLCIIGFTLFETGQVAQAAHVAELLAEHGPAAGESSVEGLCTVLLAICDIARADLEGARRRADDARRAFEEQDDVWGITMSIMVLSMAARAGGELPEARRLLEGAIARSSGMPLAPEEARMLVRLAGVELELGEHEAAIRRARAALALVRAGHGDHETAVRALALLAQLAEREGDPIAAQLLAEQAVGSETPAEPSDGWRRANAILSLILLGTGDVDGAAVTAERAFVGSEQVVETHLDATLAAASVALAQGDRARARFLIDDALAAGGHLRLPVVTSLRSLRAPSPA
jgi:class 3 adenylate cyclase/tetratricopeptide (TPR) repeat protein